MKIASVPCGLTDDLLLIQNSDHMQLIGIDLDQDSLSAARDNAQSYNNLLNFPYIDKDFSSLR